MKIPKYSVNLPPIKHNYTMKNKSNRLDSIKMIISSKEIGSQEELLRELLSLPNRILMTVFRFRQDLWGTERHSC